ncbi:hypothetical protein ACFE04_016539 [Oxalis oulophora]
MASNKANMSDAQKVTKFTKDSEHLEGQKYELIIFFPKYHIENTLAKLALETLLSKHPTKDGFAEKGELVMPAATTTTTTTTKIATTTTTVALVMETSLVAIGIRTSTPATV